MNKFLNQPRCVRLQGGLGNQIFQYVFAKCLSEEFGGPVWLDVRHLSILQPPRRFQLPQIFDDSEQMLLVDDSCLTLPLRSLVIARWVQSPRIARLIGGRSVVVEGHGPSQDGLPYSGVYWVGYWQSKKYVDSVRSELMRHLMPMSGEVHERFSASYPVELADAVALHVRRGDYVTNLRANQHHGVTPVEYFDTARSYLKNILGHLNVLVFSDDIEWAKANLMPSGDRLFFVESFSDVDELMAMQMCGHHVISNSSFSWWGACLRSSDHGIRIAPKQWYANDLVREPDLFDETWVRL